MGPEAPGQQRLSSWNIHQLLRRLFGRRRKSEFGGKLPRFKSLLG